MTKRTAPLILLLIVLGVYYPAIFAGVNSLDDFRMLDELPAASGLDLPRLFNPVGSVGYYRPLTILSYYLDYAVIGMTPESMHLENILIHLANSLLVMIIGGSVFRNSAQRVELAFSAAVLFALHPVNVEAVAWISGRTDPLASLFVLLAVCCAYRFAATRCWPWLWGGAVLCLVGGMAKEVAIFSLPAVFLLVCVNDELLKTALGQRRIMAVWGLLTRLCLPFFLNGAIYLVLRLGTVQLVKQQLAVGAGAGSSTPAAAMLRLAQDTLASYGFYFKKLFLPLPLNFAITTIDHAYVWLGMAVFLATVYASCRLSKTVYAQMLGATVLVLVSAIIISRINIAWTPYAERYLYLPSAFFALGVVDAGRLLSDRVAWPRVGVLGAFVIFAAMAAITAQRALIWQDNLTLYQDTVKKSPNLGSIHNELAIALTVNNRLVEAQLQIEQGKKADKQGDNALLYVNQALIYGYEKKYALAYRVLASTYERKNMSVDSAHIEVIKTYIHLLERERVYTRDSHRAKEIIPKLLYLHQLYARRAGDYDHLYRAGQLALACGMRDNARELFATVAEKAPRESMYRGFAAKMVGKLREGH